MNEEVSKERVMLRREKNGDPFGGYWEVVNPRKTTFCEDGYEYVWAYIEHGIPKT